MKMAQGERPSITHILLRYVRHVETDIDGEGFWEEMLRCIDIIAVCPDQSRGRNY